MGCPIGQEVGYSIRFEDVSSAKTRIKYLTDGMLLREALVDPLLSRYSVIMVDEAHERSLSTDVLLGILKKIHKKRKDLRIIVSSATLQAEEFLRFFTETTTEDEKSQKPDTDDQGKILYLGGRMYPVDIHYLEQPAPDYVERALQTVFDIHRTESLGDILIFLIGQEEINHCAQEIYDRSHDLHPTSPRISPVPLYAGLPTEQQMAVFEPPADNTRKVVLATNIAEASVTIEGIVYVIDCGFVKLRAFNPSTGIETLTPTPISKASAIQRAGRAGRTKPGKCYRLYTEHDYNTLQEATSPEIQRSNLASTILQLKALGIDNIARFDFFTSPPAELAVRALELLYSLGALDSYAKLTKPLGLRMAELLALEPMMAKALLNAPEHGCLSEILSIAAMTSLQGSVWFAHDGGERKASETSRRKFAAEEGDHLTLLNVYHAFVTKGRKDAQWCKRHHLNYKSMTKAVSIRNQLRRYLERFGIDVSESLAGAPVVEDIGERVRKCLVSGFFAQAAKMQPDGSFKAVDGGTTLHAHPSSLIFNRKADWTIFQSVTETASKTYIRDITKIERSWLMEYSGGYYNMRS
ncbi:MAG: hypothetical protein M1831_003005 [Alyxoria varia]|nr:MAG: hypothetical protein M1831_003005 [Alyxoria varia]